MMPKDPLQYIKAIRKHPLLYDPNHDDYRNVELKCSAWREVCEELGTTVGQAKSKWKNIRDSFFRMRKTNKLGKGENLSRWPWAKHMDFLDKACPFSASRKKPKIEPETSMSGSEQDYSEPHQSHHVEAGELMMPAAVAAATDGNLMPPEQFNEYQMDRIDYLFLSYAATFKTFNPRTQAMLKIKLANLFGEMELAELQQQDTRYPGPSSSAFHFEESKHQPMLIHLTDPLNLK